MRHPIHPLPSVMTRAHVLTLLEDARGLEVRDGVESLEVVDARGVRQEEEAGEHEGAAHPGFCSHCQ